MYKIQLEQFEGPLDLLLELIEDRKLDISNVSLAAVTEQFLGYLSQSAGLHPEELADFLVVAAKLLLIKSRTLLPTLDAGDAHEHDLEKQLRLYREFYEASKKLHALVLKRRYTYARGTNLRILASERSFRPPVGVVSDDLARLFRVILKRLTPFVTISEDVIIKTVNIKEKINDIRKQILNTTTLSFQSLLERATSRTDIIVTFLALLELVKMRVIAVVQDEMFSGINIHRRTERQGEQQ